MYSLGYKKNFLEAMKIGINFKVNSEIGQNNLMIWSEKVKGFAKDAAQPLPKPKYLGVIFQ